MVRYIIKRLLQSLLTILIIVSVVFLLMRMMPTDYFFTEDELIKLTEAQKQSKLEAAGLLDPPLVQLKHFFQNMFKVDYIYTGKQQALINTQLQTGVTECVHSAVSQAIKASYTDAEAAEKEIDKINNKILTDTIITKQIDAALQGEKGTDSAWVADQLATNLASKALGTLFKDAKKTIGEDQAARLRDELDAKLHSDMAGVLSGVDLDVNATGFKNIVNHLKPSNYNFTFSLGESYRIRHGISVIEIIADKFPVSMKIGLWSLALALVLGVVLGILQARYKGGILDNVCSGYTIFINAVPHLVSYTLIMYLCAHLFNLPMTYRSATPVLSSIPPILCLSTASTANYMLWMRRYMVDELNKDYIRLAQLKGFTTTQVMFRHVMKNAFLPLAQYLPYNILLTVGGSLLAESFFSVPGMGPLLTQAISRYDTNLVQAIVLFYATLGILGVFIGDLLMGILDPRISLTKKGGTR
ncbi:MAG: ABC transporter permease [Clostridiales bacterium]|nr:ABC transporter permease [Clostridia bacterium]MCR4884866.1 ABC transporter permease [Clostridiales bacterium]